LDAGLWISKDMLMRINISGYTDLGDDTYIIYINRNTRQDDYIPFHGNLEAKIGLNLNLLIRRKVTEQEEEEDFTGSRKKERDFEWCIMLQEKLQFYSFK
jgi:hypothetical protein